MRVIKLRILIVRVRAGILFDFNILDFSFRYWN